MSDNPADRPFTRKGGTDLKGRIPDDAANHPEQIMAQRNRMMSDKQPDKTGARHPDLKPEQQGITQDEANKVGDLRNPENVRDLRNIADEAPGDARELGDNKMGEHDPPEAAELGGAKTSPEASGQVGGQRSGGSGGEEQNRKMQEATSRANRTGKPDRR